MIVQIRFLGFSYSHAFIRSGLDSSPIGGIMPFLMQPLDYNSYIVCATHW
jgi:hypothetical protein